MGQLLPELGLLSLGRDVPLLAVTAARFVLHDTNMSEHGRAHLYDTDLSDLVHQSLFQHASRPEWGGALIAWERDGKRGYQFEDGQLRIFTTGHYYLLEPIAASF